MKKVIGFVLAVFIAGSAMNTVVCAEMAGAKKVKAQMTGHANQAAKAAKKAEAKTAQKTEKEKARAEKEARKAKKKAEKEAKKAKKRAEKEAAKLKKAAQ